MNHTSADYPSQVLVVEDLRSTGARIYEAHELFYCEVRSTLPAMGVSRRAGLRCLVDSGAPLYQRIILPDGASVFVTDADINRLLGLLDGAPQPQDALIRMLHQKHGKVCRYLPWPYLAVTCGMVSVHAAVVAWLHWFCIDCSSAHLRYGPYNIATNHEPPPSHLLVALEFKEQGRDLCNRFFLGLEDADDITDWDRGDRRNW